MTAFRLYAYFDKKGGDMQYKKIRPVITGLMNLCFLSLNQKIFYLLHHQANPEMTYHYPLSYCQEKNIADNKTTKTSYIIYSSILIILPT